MIEVRIPKEIKEYKVKLLFGFSLRETICSVLALGICVPLYVYGRMKNINEDALGYAVMIIAAPLVLIGFFSYNQLTFEQFFIEWMKTFVYPQKRLYRQETIYDAIRREIIEDANSKGKRQGKTKTRKTTKNKKEEE